MDTFYPGVVARFKRVAQTLKDKYGVEPQFGYFYCVCFNIPVPHLNRRVLLRPHLDFKNPIAVCLVYVFCKKGCESQFVSIAQNEYYAQHCVLKVEFCHKEKAWLVIWELGVVVELPPGVFALFPSSLLYHFNIDIEGEPRVIFEGKNQ